MESAYDWIQLLKTYKTAVNQNNLVIEIGASNKKRTKQLAKYCQKLTGVEYYKKRILKSFDNIKYVQGDWQNLKKIKSDSFDILVSSHTIEHIKNDLKAINETYRVLKTPGVALITTPNRNRLIRVLLEFFTGKRKFPHHEHQREYSYHDLQILLSKSNFKNYQIIPLAFGIHAWKIKLYSKKIPKKNEKYACYWLIKLKK